MKDSTPRSDDQRLLRRAARTVAAQTALATAVVVLAVAALSFLFVAREQTEQARTTVRDTATSVDGIRSVSPGVFVLERSPVGTTRASAGTPSALAGLDLSAVTRGAGQVQVGADAYQVYLSRRPDGTRYAAFVDLDVLASGRRRLFGSLALAGVFGILGAAAVGHFIGRRASGPLGAALALRRRFVADASHELRAPLTVLHTRAQLLARRASSSDDPRLRELAEDLVADSHAMGGVVEDLLRAAEYAHRSDHSELVDVCVLLDETVRVFGPYANERGVALVRSGQGSDGPILLAGVRAALSRAVNALVDNALAHEHTGEPCQWAQPVATT